MTLRPLFFQFNVVVRFNAFIVALLELFAVNATIFLPKRCWLCYFFSQTPLTLLFFKLDAANAAFLG